MNEARRRQLARKARIAKLEAGTRTAPHTVTRDQYYDQRRRLERPPVDLIDADYPRVDPELAIVDALARLERPPP